VALLVLSSSSYLTGLRARAGLIRSIGSSSSSSPSISDIISAAESSLLSSELEIFFYPKYFLIEFLASLDLAAFGLV
jgi:hypothetical protein